MNIHNNTPWTLPNRYLPNWARLCGVETTVMDRYCYSIHLNDKLPRGMEKKLYRLRTITLKAVRQCNSPQ